jgi:dolichol-phosphate mannosyltransferase
MANRFYSHGFGSKKESVLGMKKVVAVIAAYNEEKVIGPLTQALIRALDGLADVNWQLIYVIEGKDSTLSQAQDFARARPEIKILYNEQPSGLGRAFRRGFDAVPLDADLVVTMDADFNHQPADIADMIAAMNESGADIIVGSRRLDKSVVEGVPAWKSILSRTVNRIMRSLMGVNVKDMTSGFRLYRAAALRRLEFSSVGFAFLPEMLIKAVAQKMKIVERPIRFVFREVGESKMAFGTTSLSYIRLFVRYSIPAYAWLAVAILLLGTAVRVGFSYPAHMFPGDSDGVLAGLCGLEVMDGKLPLFFPGGYRLSSQSCYVSAGMFTLFGVGRAALAGTSVFYGILFLIFLWLALKEAVGGKNALFGALIGSVPPLQVLLVTYPPWGYGEIMAFSACTMWLGLRLMDKSKPHTWLDYLIFGASVGFSFWTSPQTLMVSGPVLAMLLFLRALPLRSIPLVVAGAVVCLYPYFLLIAYRGIGPLHSFASQPVTSVGQLRSNLTYLLLSVIPELFFTYEWSRLSFATLNGVRALTVSAISAGAIMVVSASRLGEANALTKVRRALVLALLILTCSVLLYTVSGAGAIRGWTVRYIVPVFIVLPLFFGISFAGMNRRGYRLCIAVIALFLCLAHSTEYPFLVRAARDREIRDATENERLISWLARQQREVAVGDYWTVYHLNFDFDRSVRGIPIEPQEDYFAFAESLPNRARTALLDRDRSHLETWARLVGLVGHVEQLSDNLFAYEIDSPIGPSQLYQIRLAASQLPRVF